MFPIIILIVFNETQKYKGINTQLGQIDPFAFGVSAGLKKPTPPKPAPFVRGNWTL